MRIRRRHNRLFVLISCSLLGVTGLQAKQPLISKVQHPSLQIPEITNSSPEFIIAKQIEGNSFARILSNQEVRSSPQFEVCFKCASMWDEYSIPGRITPDGLQVRIQKSLKQLRSVTSEILKDKYNLCPKEIIKVQKQIEIIEGLSHFVDDKTLARAFSLVYLSEALKAKPDPTDANTAHDARIACGEPEELFFKRIGTTLILSPEEGFDHVRKDGKPIFFEWLPLKDKNILLYHMKDTFQSQILKSPQDSKTELPGDPSNNCYDNHCVPSSLAGYPSR